MKLQKLTCVAVLGALALGAVAPTALAAEDAREIAGKGIIKYVEDDESENNGKEVPDPEDPGKIIEVPETDGENNNDKKGTLRVDFLSHLKFGLNNKITTKATDYFASATNGTQQIGGAPVKRGNFVAVTDKRGNGSEGWTLSAEVTKGFTNGDNEVLNGAQITYTLPYVNSSQDKANYPVAAPTVVLAASVGSKVMATADKGKGWGAYTIEYGRPALDAQGNVVENGPGSTPATMEEAVKLSVPANTALKITSAYEAEITWTIAEL